MRDKCSAAEIADTKYTTSPALDGTTGAVPQDAYLFILLNLSSLSQLI